MTAFLILLMVFLFSWQSLSARKYTESYAGPHPQDTSNIYNIIYGCVIALLTLAINGFSFAPSLPTVLLGLVNAVVLIVYNTSLVSGSVLGPYSFLMLCPLSGGILVPMVYNMLLMGERLSAMQIFGILILLVSIVILNLQGLSFKGERPPRAYFLCCALLFFSNGFYGQLLNIQQSLLSGAQRAEMIVVTYSVAAVIALCTMLHRSPQRLREGLRMGRKAALFALFACVVATSATNIMVYLLTVVQSVTVMFAIDNGGVLLLSAIYSLVLFREKSSPSQITGMALAILSIVLLSI